MKKNNFFEKKVYMKFLVASILLISLKSWAGIQISLCSNNDVEKPIHSCIEWNRMIGILKISGERVKLQFSEDPQVIAEFQLSSSKSGQIQMLDLSAVVQLKDEDAIILSCSSIKPGTCK